MEGFPRLPGYSFYDPTVSLCNVKRITTGLEKFFGET